MINFPIYNLKACCRVVAVVAGFYAFSVYAYYDFLCCLRVVNDDDGGYNCFVFNKLTFLSSIMFTNKLR